MKEPELPPAAQQRFSTEVTGWGVFFFGRVRRAHVWETASRPPLFRKPPATRTPSGANPWCARRQKVTSCSQYTRPIGSLLEP